MSMRPSKLTCLAAAVAAATLLLAACGGDGDDEKVSVPTTIGTDTAYADALVGSISGVKDAFGLSTEQTFCLANGLVDAYGGAADLADRGITPEDLAGASSPSELGLAPDDDAIEDAVTTISDCQVDVVSIFIDGLAVEFTMTAEAETCLRERLDQPTLARLVAMQLVTGEQGEAPDLAGQISPCLEILSSSTSVQPSA